MYRSRLVLVTALALLVLAAIAALFLIPSYVALRVAAPPVPDAQVSTGEEQDILTLQRTQFLIRDLEKTLVVATSSMKVVEEALALRPSGIRVLRIAYERVEGGGRLTLSGDGTRDTITGYRDALTRSGKFTGVSVPVGALVPAEGGAFTIVVSGHF